MKAPRAPAIRTTNIQYFRALPLYQLIEIPLILLQLSGYPLPVILEYGFYFHAE